MIALTIWLEDSVLGLERDIIALLDFLTPAVERVLHGALEWCVALITVIVYLGPADHQALPPVLVHPRRQRRWPSA